jgi:hypothetical protein
VTWDAFASYAASDGRRAEQLCAGLRAVGIRVWLDAEDLRAPRTTWREATRVAIRESRAVLILLSPPWVESPGCRFELAVARERYVPLIAVPLDHADIALAPPEAEIFAAGSSMDATIQRLAPHLANRRSGNIP